MSASSASAPLFFRSGCSRVGDMRAAIRAGVAVGVSMVDLSATVIAQVAGYLRDGGQVFVDTGAFGAFRKGRPLGDAEFSRHLSVCLELARMARPGSLHVVSPDVVGDQDATVALLSAYAPRLTEVAAAGATVIVPLQQGRLALAEFLSLAQRILAPAAICAGLPSNAAALTTDDTLAFIRSARPAMAHFLGAARNRRFQAMLADARAISPDTRFTYDAAVLRGICGDIGLRGFTKPARAVSATELTLLPGLSPVPVAPVLSDEKLLFGYRGENTPASIPVCARATEVLNAGDIDPTEISPYLNPADGIAIRAASHVVGVPESEFRAHMEEGDEMREEYENILGGYWAYFVDLYARLSVKRDWRSASLAAHPSFRLNPHDRGEQGLLAI